MSKKVGGREDGKKEGKKGFIKQKPEFTKYVLCTRHAPGALQILYNSILTIILGGRCCYPHFTNKETVAHRE